MPKKFPFKPGDIVEYKFSGLSGNTMDGAIGIIKEPHSEGMEPAWRIAIISIPPQAMTSSSTTWAKDPFWNECNMTKITELTNETETG
jgi:hypothetical protein